MISGENIDFDGFSQEEIKPNDKNLQDGADRHIMIGLS